MPVLRSERRALIERSSPYRRPRAAGAPSTPPVARTSVTAPSTCAGTGAGTGARELVERFVQWQQPHAWKQLEGVERLWATSDLHVEHESNLAFLRGLDGYSEVPLTLTLTLTLTLILTPTPTPTPTQTLTRTG